MIRSFKDIATGDIYHGISSRKTRKFSDEIIHIAVRKLDQLNASFDINDMRVPPGKHLEKLKGDLKNYYSIRIDVQYRIVFQWKNGDAFNVSIVDYH